MASLLHPLLMVPTHSPRRVVVVVVAPLSLSVKLRVFKVIITADDSLR